MTALSTETTAAIIFGVLQLSLNLMTFWEQRQTRRMQGKFVQEPCCFGCLCSFRLELRMDGRRHTF